MCQKLFDLPLFEYSIEMWQNGSVTNQAVEEMKAYLTFLGLEKHVLEFEYNKITFKNLDGLSDDNWKNMGVPNTEREIICNSLQAWKLHKNKKAKKSVGPASGVANFLRKTFSREQPQWDIVTTIDYTFKIVVIGPPSTGKTSLVKRFAHNQFDSYRSTIGVDWESKSIQWNSTTNISVMLYDCSGQDRFLDIVPQYYRNACAALVVFDVTNLKSLETAITWRESLEKYKNTFIHSNIPIILIGNKCDQEHETLDWDLICKECRFLKCWLTSARENVNITNTLHEIVKLIMSQDKEVLTKLETGKVKSDSVVLRREVPTQKTSCMCK